MTIFAGPRTGRPRPGAVALLLRIELSLLGIVALGHGAAISLFLPVFRRGDTCRGEPAAHGPWEYVGQLAPAARMAEKQ